MSNSNKLTSVNILDKDYQVACPPEEKQALLKAADELDNRMRAIRNSGSIIGLERIAVMAALNLCYELHEARAKAQNTPVSEDAALAIEAMRAKIAQALAQEN